MAGKFFDRMSRRQFLAKTVISSLGLAAGSCVYNKGLQGVTVNTNNRPNFVILFTDDQRWDSLSCISGYPMLKTPNIDRLAKTGVLFENAFVPTPICMCSRATLASGMYTSVNRVHRFFDLLPDKVRDETYHALLKKAGYRTGCLGKWGVGADEKVKAMFDFWDAWADQGHYFHKVGDKEVHDSEWLADRTEDFLNGCSKGQPFCLTVNYKSPHYPWTPAPEDDHLFDKINVPRQRKDTERHNKMLPEFVRDSFLKACYDADCSPEKYEDWIKDYLECIAGVDRSVGRIMSMLKERGLTDNTVVFYLSDHGMFAGEHKLMGKWLLREESIRIPMIINYPKLPAAMKGSRLEDIVLQMDVAPTVVSMAGVKVPAEMDGADLTPLLEGEKTQWRKDFMLEHYFAPAAMGRSIPRSVGVRTERWKYYRYTDPTPDVERLFDLQNDPFEENNLAGNAGYKDVLEQMRKRYDYYRRKYPNTYQKLPYDKRFPQCWADEIDLERFKKIRPEVYDKLEKYLKENNLEFDEVMRDFDERREMAKAIGYTF